MNKPTTPSTDTVTGNNNLKRLLLMVGVPLCLALIGCGVYLQGGRYISTDNAYIKADKIPVSAQVSAPVVSINVSENQQVAAGDLLFSLDPAEFEVAKAKAEAKLAQVRTDLASLKASYHEKEAEIVLAKTRYKFSKKLQSRQADLLASHYVSANNYDDAEQNAEITAQQIVTLQHDLVRIAQSLGGSIEMPIEQHPAYLAAQAELAQANLNLAHLAVKASVDGVVSKLPKTGQFVSAGSTVATLVANKTLWIEANFTETDLTFMRAGQAVTIEVDTYPGAHWQGTVESVSPATGAEFSIIPAQNATGNWVKITQRVPVRIAIQPANNAPPLLAGLSVEVKVDTEHQRRLLGVSL